MSDTAPKRTVMRDRLIGALVLTLLGMAFLPMLFDGDGVHPELALQPELPADTALDNAAESPDPDDWREEDWQFPVVADELAATAEVDGTPAGQVRLTPDPIQPAVEAPDEPPSESPAIAVTEPAISAPDSPPAAAAPAPAPLPQPQQPIELGAWAVQVGAFRSADRAAVLKEQLASAGLNVMLSESVNSAGVRVTRVATGPHVSRAEANAAAAELRERHGLDPIVVQVGI